MPLYNYQCADCGTEEEILAGVDDHIALCQVCDGAMVRTDTDIWAPLWEEQGQLQEDVP